MGSLAAIRRVGARIAAASRPAHPDDDRLVPACVQHSVLDPAQNLALRELLARPAPHRFA